MATSSGSKRLTPGTPVGGERIPQMPFTPESAKHPEKVARLSNIMHNMATPESDQDRHRPQESITMDALRNLFDEKLQPIATSVKQMQHDFKGLQHEVHENNAVALANFESLSTDIDSLQKRVSDVEILTKNNNMSDNNAVTSEDYYSNHISEKLKEMEREIAALRMGHHMGNLTMNKDHEKTVVVGGMKDWDDEAQAVKFLSGKLWESWAPIPSGHFASVPDSGIVFLKFDTQKDRDAALNVLLKIKQEDKYKQVWAKPSQPLEVRIVQQVAFGAKWLLHRWGFPKRSMWVDEATGILWMGQEQVVQASFRSEKLEIEYGKGWEEYMTGAEWNEVTTKAFGKEKKLHMEDKGKGKGKEKGK